MLIARLILVLGGVLGIAAGLLFLLTGNRAYLRVTSRVLLTALLLLVLVAIGRVAGRLLGILL